MRSRVYLEPSEAGLMEVTKGDEMTIRELRLIAGERDLTETESAQMTALKNELVPNTRNVTVETIYNEQGDVLRVNQSFVVVPVAEARETQYKETVI